MRMRLATQPNAQACSGDVCVENQLFDAQVRALGEHLAQSAYVEYPDLKKKVPNFEFGVAEKKVVGSASNARGTVILFRGLQHMDLGGQATAFIVAREMGHVIANHHKSNAKTKIFFTVLAGVLFPAVNILSASGAAAQATTATTLLTSAASTATSYVGSEVALSRIKPTQLTEADDIALKLLAREGLSSVEVAQALEYIVENEKSTAWEKDLYLSTQYVRKVAGEPVQRVAELEPLPDAYVAPEANIHAPLQPVIIAAKAEESLAKPEKSALPEPKPVEPHRIILITNQTIADSHRRVELPSAVPVKTREVKKVTDKKRSSKRTVNRKADKTKTATKTKAKVSKKSSAKASPKKAKSVKKKASTKQKAPSKGVGKTKPDANKK